MDYIFPSIIGGIGFFMLTIGDNTQTFLVYKIFGVIALIVAFVWFSCVVGYNIGYSLYS